MGPLVIGLAAGALGWVLGSIGKQQGKADDKKEQPPPQPDPRIDQLMQSQAKQEGLLNQILQNQEMILGAGLGRGCGPGGQAGFGASLSLNLSASYGLLQCPASLNAIFGGAQSPSAFLGQLDRTLGALPAPC